MKIITIKTGAIKTNTYIVYDEANTEAVVVDPGEDFDKIKEVLDDAKLVAKAVLITHAHFDHVNAVSDFQKEGATVYLHEDDVQMINLKESTFKAFRAKIIPFTPDVLVKDGEELLLCGLKFTVLHTPGHSKGSVCYVVGDVIFTGDTLFYLDIGSTRFFGGNEDELLNSIRTKLFSLKDDYQILAGHGIASSLKFEKENNPYV